MKLTFYGGAGEVTGSLFHFSSKNLEFLIDCGLYQEGKSPDKRNITKFKFDAKKIDFVIITHAHLDHIGLLPKLYKEGFRGKIFCTAATKALLQCVLEDYIKVSDECKQFKVCDSAQVFGILKLAETLPYDKTLKFKNNFYFYLKDSGHILGSAFVVFCLEGKKFLVTGDLGNKHSSLHRGPEKPEEVDYIITESVYGGFLHKTGSTKRDILEDEIEDVITRKGTLMIPSFALDRSQELLYDLNYLVENHKIPYIPIFFDSPLAIEITSVYKDYSDYFPEEVRSQVERGDEIFNFPGLKVCKTKQESIEINNVSNPKIVIAGSGMSNGGRILFHELRYLSDPNSTLLVIGWQAYGTLGREIIEGASRVRIFDKEVDVRAKIKIIDGYSGHPDQHELLAWFSEVPKIPKRVFIAQAEKENAKVFMRKLMDKLGFEAEIAEKNKTYEL